MDFIELCKTRYSVRSYTSQKIEDDKLNAILEAGRLAPTAANLQPQKIIAVRSEDGLKKLGEAANIYGAPLALIVCADKTKAWKRPFDGKLTTDIDASIVTDHMMLEAADLGLGSVWICYFKPDILRKNFNIPDNIEPVNILAIGYADGNPPVKEKDRKPLADTVIRE